VNGRALALLAVVVAAVLAHLPAFDAGFVYDDARFIQQNEALLTSSPWDFFVDPATASAGTGLGESGGGIVADIYRPLRTLLFSLERRAFGLAPKGWHAVGLLLHAVNAWLVLRLLWRLLGATGPAALAGALLFAVHPVGVESVVWLSSQGDLLALALMLVTLEVLLRPGLLRTIGGAVLCLLACLAKESAIVLPALLLLRDRALASGEAPPRRVTWGRVLLLGRVVGAYFALRSSVVSGPLAQVQHPGGEVLASARGALAALAWYAGALLWPSGFSFETDLPVPLSWGEPAVVLGLGLLLTLLLVGLSAWRRGRPAVALFAAWGALVALVPVSQCWCRSRRWPPSVSSTRCCRAWLRAWEPPSPRSPPRLRRAAWLALLPALPLLLLSQQRARAWSDDESLWEAVRADRPSNWRAYEGLGFALLHKGRFQDAERAYSSYLEFNPLDGKAIRQMADQLGNLVRSLVSHDPEVTANSDLARRRTEVQALQVAMLERALHVWERVGYQAGRGSEGLAVETQMRLRDAAIDLGDLPRAKRANDWFLARSGVDPADPAQVAARGPLRERECRWFLAWMSVTTPQSAERGEARALRQAQRQAVLTDMGLQALRHDEALVRELEAPLKALRAEREAASKAAAGTAGEAAARRRAADLALLHVELLLRTGRPEEAQRLQQETERATFDLVRPGRR
jgi:tetratricopeptide (TPR) repeat protein